jgi:ketosteroid isomerase-like protein
VYHAIVRRMVRRNFDRLSEGDYSTVLRGVSPDVHHVFAGRHPLAGERRSREAFRQWFERLFRLFPVLRFEVRDIVVKGGPWRTVAAVEWKAHVTPAVGPSYINEAAHIIHLRWGRAVYVHAYEDSQAVAEACRRMADSGVEEARAEPITDTA